MPSGNGTNGSGRNGTNGPGNEGYLTGGEDQNRSERFKIRERVPRYIFENNAWHRNVDLMPDMVTIKHQGCESFPCVPKHLTKIPCPDCFKEFTRAQYTLVAGHDLVTDFVSKNQQACIRSQMSINKIINK